MIGQDPFSIAGFDRIFILAERLLPLHPLTGLAHNARISRGKSNMPPNTQQPKNYAFFTLCLSRLAINSERRTERAVTRMMVIQYSQSVGKRCITLQSKRLREHKPEGVRPLRMGRKEQSEYKCLQAQQQNKNTRKPTKATVDSISFALSLPMQLRMKWMTDNETKWSQSRGRCVNETAASTPMSSRLNISVVHDATNAQELKARINKTTPN